MSWTQKSTNTRRHYQQNDKYHIISFKRTTEEILKHSPNFQEMLLYKHHINKTLLLKIITLHQQRLNTETYIFLKSI